MKCSLCQKKLIATLTIVELFSQQPIYCYHCQNLLTPIASSATCHGCGRITSERICPECLSWQNQMGFLLENKALFHYDEGFKKWIEAYKYQGDFQLRHSFSRQLKQAVKKIPYDLLCPLPLSEERFIQRGFNQVTSCLETAGIKGETLLTRRHFSKSQASKKRQERLEMPQPFSLKENCQIRNQRILLVDDVYTTGRTLYHAAAVLYQGEAKKVLSLTFAR